MRLRVAPAEKRAASGEREMGMKMEMEMEKETFYVICCEFIDLQTETFRFVLYALRAGPPSTTGSRSLLPLPLLLFACFRSLSLSLELELSTCA